jgi:hypothetical protein
MTVAPAAVVLPADAGIQPNGYWMIRLRGR